MGVAELVHETERAGDRALEDLARGCVEVEPELGDLRAPAGPDGRFFTGDDPWISPIGGALPTGG